MTFHRYKIPLIALSILGFAKYAGMFLSKAPIYEFFGGWALFLLTATQIVTGLWFVIIPMSVLLIFYGQSVNSELGIAVSIIAIAGCYILGYIFNSMPSI